MGLPPSARMTLWSSWSRTCEPQMPPEWIGHWQRPPSRLQTSRRTAAGMWVAPGSALSSGGAGDGVRERQPRGLELLEELGRNGQVEAGLGGGERVDLHPPGRQAWCRRRNRSEGGACGRTFEAERFA